MCRRALLCAACALAAAWLAQRLGALQARRAWQQALVRIDPQLRIYVYRLQFFDASAMAEHFPWCRAHQWAADYFYIERLRSSAFVTEDAAAADFLVVPFLAKCYFNYVAGYNLARMGEGFDELLRELGRQPHWRQRPERHLFFFMSGAGASVLPGGLARLGQAIVVSAEGDREAEYFRYGHDLVVPGFSDMPAANGSEPKSLLGSMRGQMSTKTRDAEGRLFVLPNLLRHTVQQVLHGQDCFAAGDVVEFEAYAEELRSSRFCVIPRGSTPWTRRFFDILFAGCIPVVLSDPIHFPFERLLDFHRFTLKLPERDVLSLADELRAVSGEQAELLLSEVLRWRAAFDYGPGGCAFELFLTELSLRKSASLGPPPAAPAPRTNNSPRLFWSPRRGVYSEPRAAKLGPTWGAGMVFH